jgi:hypothetical protein
MQRGVGDTGRLEERGWQKVMSVVKEFWGFEHYA